MEDAYSLLVCINTSTFEPYKVDRLKPELLHRYHPESLTAPKIYCFDSNDRVKTKTTTHDLTSMNITFDPSKGFSEAIKSD
jgi:hypothetical protein